MKYHIDPTIRRAFCLILQPLAIYALMSALAAPAAEQWSAIVSPQNSLDIGFIKDQTPVFKIGLGGWGPKWAWVGISAKDKATGDKLVTGAPFVVNKANGEVIDIKLQAWKSGPKQMTLRYDLSAAKDVPITMLIAGLSLSKEFGKGKLTLFHADGQESIMDLSFKRASKPAITKATLNIENAGDVAIVFDPPCPISFDGDMRIMLASDVFKQSAQSIALTLNFPSEVAFLAKQEDMNRLTKTLAGPKWFAFTPSDDLSSSVIGMEDWLDKPAGKRGGVRMTGDHFQFEDGTPVKFWGVNLSYGGGCAPDNKSAEFTAARYAKYGVNAVRLHKFSYPKNHMGIGEINDATQMTPDGLDRLDYFASQMKQRGVYFGWSHTFGFYVCPGNRARLVAYDEIEKNLKGNTYAFIHFAEDVQDLMIEMVVNLLKHKNPHTGLAYAEEPALSFIELQNEDDIFFYTSEKAFNSCPTYRKLFIERFCDWLKSKYSSDEKLNRAWSGALKSDENLTAKNIVPQTNPWFFGDDNLPQQKGGSRQRLLDTAQFLHEAQNKFYTKFVKAIRDAGYKGPICGSPWQAPSMLPHYYNLRSDYLAGYIDRHNYFGGGLFDSMLAKPGSGYFSSGMQQVADRPFGLSEWIHVYPSLYSAEGLAIIAAYGMGLQGWDASYEFQSQSAKRMFSDRAGWPPWGVWEADVPTQLGQYPALARMIYRGDVKESEVISTRRVSMEEMIAGNFSFSDKVTQQGDIKSFGGSVPPEALAAGRVVVEFTDKPQPSTFPDMAKYRAGSAIQSATKQLVWDTDGKGYFTINTPGTKGVVGFAEGKSLALGDVTINAACPYASILLTALDKGGTLANAKSALLCAVARNCNSGFQYFAIDLKTLENGKGPILLEPVKATITIAGRAVSAVNILDHNGRRTGATLPVNDGRFDIDGAKDKTLYYEITFK
ncbi:MAG: beta-galactosidase [Candidatus Sumerlaeota bacterium]|nr:beta-galactosidase [Candidatus Sumerlaeota bacterium]